MCVANALALLLGVLAKQLVSTTDRNRFNAALFGQGTQFGDLTQTASHRYQNQTWTYLLVPSSRVSVKFTNLHLELCFGLG